MIAILGMLTGVLLVLGIGVLATKHQLLVAIYDVRLSDDAVVFVLFSKFNFYRLPFTNIEKVIYGKGGYHFLTAVDFRNRFFSPSFLILKKSGAFTRKVSISPADPKAFVEALAKANVPMEDR